MALNTYADLKTSILDWSNKTNLTAMAPDFVRLAESKIRKKLRTRDQLTALPITLTDDLGSLPTDMLEVRSVVVDGNVLSYVPEEVYDQLAEFATDPINYTFSGSQIKVAGGGDSTARLDYYHAYTALSAASDTNWVLTNAPEVYLYGSLVEAFDYLRDGVERDRYMQKFEQTVAELNLTEKVSLSAGPMRVRPDTFTP